MDSQAVSADNLQLGCKISSDFQTLVSSRSALLTCMLISAAIMCLKDSLQSSRDDQRQASLLLDKFQRLFDITRCDLGNTDKTRMLNRLIPNYVFASDVNLTHFGHPASTQKVRWKDQTVNTSKRCEMLLKARASICLQTNDGVKRHIDRPM